MDSAVTGLLGLLVGALLTGLRSYTSEKGKNLATKEDVSEITTKVESVRNEHIAQIERLKADLTQQQTINRTQYEMELTAFREVWEALLPVHRAAARLRPMWDSGLEEGETEQSRKRERLAKFYESLVPFGDVVWRHRPFYPANVFDELSELLRLMQLEAVQYRVFDPNRKEDYWERAIENVDALNSQVNKVCDTIRVRLSVARVA